MNSIYTEMAETLANKLEYCMLVGDVDYTTEDFYREQGVEVPPDYVTFLLMKAAKEILDRRANAKDN